LKALLSSQDNWELNILRRHSEDISLLASLVSLEITSKAEKVKNGIAAATGKTEIFVLPDQEIDLEGKIQRLHKEIAQIEKELTFVEDKLTNEKFLSKAPKEIVEKNVRRKDALKEKETKLRKGVERIRWNG
jgi:valyl-tRNA synthetase